MEGEAAASAFSNLPAWALFGLGVVWLTFQFVQKFLEKQTEKREQSVRREYRKKRTEERLTNHSFDGKSSVRDGLGRPSEDTGRHDLRAILDEERERDQRMEILGNTRAHVAMMEKLVDAETGQAALLKQLVKMQESHSQTLKTVVATQNAIVRFLTTQGDGAAAAPGATLREMPGFPGEGIGG